MYPILYKIPNSTKWINLTAWVTLATLMVCCSMASCMLALSCSRMLLNSSIQHSPPSARTRAPASSCHSPLSWTQREMVTDKTHNQTLLTQLCSRANNSGMWGSKDIPVEDTCSFLVSAKHPQLNKDNDYSHFFWALISFFNYIIYKLPHQNINILIISGFLTI